jgi:flagellar basal-body rod protein FlgF
MLDRFVYTAMTGAKHAMGQLGNTTHNLANAQTPGFREMLSTFRAVPVQGASADSRAFVVDSTPGSNFAPGPLTSTGNPLDVAIKEKGFFAVIRGDGKEVYTRSGHLTLDDEGFLRGASGTRMVGVEGDIWVEPGSTDLQIGPTGLVQAVLPGDSQSSVIGQLKLVNPPPHTLTRDGDGFFVNDGTALPQSDDVVIQSNVIEMSNVNVASAMVEMIQQNRLFDLNIRMVQVAEQNAKSASNLMSLSRG